MSLSGIRFRCQPETALQAVLRVWMGHQRFTRNAKVRERRAAYAERREHKDDQRYSHRITPECAFLKDVPSQLLRNGVARYTDAVQRFKAGLNGAPRIKRRHGRQSVLLTRELFRFVSVPGRSRDKRRGWVIELGTEANPVGTLPFIAHRDWEMPASITISVEPEGAWFVSFSYEAKPLRNGADEPFIERTPEELLYELNNRSDLEAVVWAGDRGVAVPLMGSDGRAFDFSDVQKERLTRAEQQKRKYQRRMARCAKTVVDGKKRVSRGYLKHKRRAAKHAAYCRNTRQDFAHQASHVLVEGDVQVLAFEDLNIKNMTAAILRSAWGLVQRFTAYKAAQRNKLVYELPSAYSSQTCSKCGHCHADNRRSQALFACVACGHTANADVNAAMVLQQWAVQKVRAGEVPALKGKQKKRVAFRRKSKDLPNSALEQELLEVTSESGAHQSSPGAQASNDAAFRGAA